jgi:CheY-like chemotaxis protein
VESKPDAIVMDIIMPDQNGDEVAARLKKTAETKSIPIILVTADFMKENRGVAEYFVRRPVPAEALKDILKKIFRE